MKAELCERMIEILLAAKRHIPVAEIAGQLQVSTKTVHNYLRSPQFCGQLRPCSLEKKQRLGVKLVGTEQQIGALRKKIAMRDSKSGQCKVPLLDDGAYMVKTLFTSSGPYTSQLFADELYRSKSSVASDLEAVRRWLRPRGVLLMKKENVGVWIEGDERKIRAAYRAFGYSARFDGERGWRAGSGALSGRHYGRLVKLFGERAVDKAAQILLPAEIVLGGKFTEHDFYDLLMKVNIWISRIRVGRLVSGKNAALKNIHEFLAAQIMKLRVEEQFRVKIPEEELYELTGYLLAARRQKAAVNQAWEFLMNEEIARRFIDGVSACLQTDLAGDEVLVKNLILHLQPAIRRIRYGAKTENPLLSKIRHEYTNIYLAVLTSIEELEHGENIAFDADEIGYICLHIAAAINRREKGSYINACLVCNGGNTIGGYLESVIQRQLQEINITKVCVSEEFDHASAERFDLILDATQLIENEGAKVISIHEFFEPDDASRIRQWILGKHMLDFHEVKDGLKEQVLYFNDDVGSKEEVLSKYGAYLFEQGYVLDGYGASMIEREKRASTAMGRYIAVPHGAKNLVVRSVLAIINLKHTIPWDDFNVDLIFILAVNFAKPSGNHAFFQRLYDIIKDERLIARIKGAANRSDIEQLFFEVQTRSV